MVSGLTAGLAAFLGASFYGSASCGDATGYELYVIASAVVGGASLTGGKGSAINAMLGALLIVLIRQSIRTLHFDQNYEWIIIGCAIIVAVVLDQASAGSRLAGCARRLRREREASRGPSARPDGSSAQEERSMSDVTVSGSRDRRGAGVRDRSAAAVPAAPAARAPVEPITRQPAGRPAHRRGKRFKIAMIAKSSTNPVFLSARTGAEAAAKELSAKTGVPIEIDWLTPPTEDGQVQAQRIAQAVNEGANAILISCSDAGKVTGAINDAVARGVPVMTFDSDAPESKRFAFYGVDDVETGQHGDGRAGASRWARRARSRSSPATRTRRTCASASTA